MLLLPLMKRPLFRMELSEPPRSKLRGIVTGTLTGVSSTKSRRKMAGQVSLIKNSPTLL
jgi:hypothetical protein